MPYSRPTISASSSASACCCSATAGSRVYGSSTEVRHTGGLIHNRLYLKRYRVSKGNTLRQFASTGEKDRKSENNDGFAKQLWDAARQGIDSVEEADSGGSTEALFSSDSKDIDALFRESKRLYSSRDIGLAANMYADALENSGKYQLDSYLFDQSFDGDNQEQQQQVSARAVCLFNCACCYAAFGELETAQQYIRDAASYNLNVKKLLSTNTKVPFNSDAFKSAVLPPVGSVQVLNQLRRFSDSLAVESIGTGPKVEREPRIKQGVTEDVEIIGMDGSILGIIRRLLILISVLSVLGGAVLWAGRVAWYS